MYAWDGGLRDSTKMRPGVGFVKNGWKTRLWSELKYLKKSTVLCLGESRSSGTFTHTYMTPCPTIHRLYFLTRTVETMGNCARCESHLCEAYSTCLSSISKFLLSERSIAFQMFVKL